MGRIRGGGRLGTAPSPVPSNGAVPPPRTPSATTRRVAFDLGGTRFQVRAAAVVLHEGRLLVSRIGDRPYVELPGGRIDAGETSAQALRRELEEETGVDVEPGPLLWVVETFFTFESRPFHEIGWYHAVTLPRGASHLLHADRFAGHEPGVDLLYEWVSLADLGRVRLFPSFLRDAVARTPAAPQVLVHAERERLSE